jgi:hypothetical protein
MVFATLAAAALMLPQIGSQAQYAPNPYGAASRRASVSVDPFYTSLYPYGVFGGAAGQAAYPVGAVNNGYGYGYYGIGGSTSPQASAAYFGYGLPNAYAGYPYGYAVNGFGNVYTGDNISVVNGPLNGGFAVVNPNGAYFIGPNGTPATPQISAGGNITTGPASNGDINVLPNRGVPNANPQYPPLGSNQNPGNTNANITSPTALRRMVVAQQDANFNVNIGWIGDPKLVAGMRVTLLNRYHLPIISGTTSDGLPVTFTANPGVYAARYYRADIQLRSGAVVSVMGNIQR